MEKRSFSSIRRNKITENQQCKNGFDKKTVENIIKKIIESV